MGVRVEAMHNPARIEQATRGRMLFRRLAAVFLVGLVTGVGLSFIGLANRTISPAAFDWAISAGLGLVCGFAARQALRDHTALLRLLASIAAVTVSMLFAGWVSGGDAGLVLDHTARQTADWSGFVQLMCGAASAFLAMAAWRRRPARPSAELAAATAATDGPGRATIRPSVGLAERAMTILPGARYSLQSWFALRADRVRRGFSRQVRGWKSTWHGSRWSRRLPEWMSSPRLRPRREVLRRSRVRLLGVEEHRCPYCLDIVERHDPRGVVTCKVCHTRHHADCWAMTGMCQVPHHHR